MHYIVALTGGIGSGKSTVASAFTALGVPLVDADVIARQVVQPGSPALRAIADRFGLMMLCADGSLNRAALKKQIFKAPNDKSWLNDLLHPLIQKKTEQQFRSVRTLYMLWVVPLLIENNLQRRANRILVVDVEHRIQITRTMSRDGSSRSQVKKILDAQVPRQQRLACADDIIHNSGHPEEIKNHVTILHRRYLTLAALETQQDKSSSVIFTQ
ncbi:MAG: dephospho-CoA kinase [Sodalis sp. Ffu]|nr:MAG: dephospho-CoA kinase [Sodalis sp. Ffu]